MSEEKKELILEKAKEVIASKGYYAASIKEIAERANVAQGTPYLYFKSKEEMFIELLLSFEDNIDATVKEAINLDIDFWGKIEHILKSTAGLFSKDEKMMTILRREMPEPLGIGKKGMDQIQEIHNKRTEKMNQIFTDLKGETEFNSKFSEEELRRICMMVIFGMMKTIEHGEERDTSEAAELAIKILKEVLQKR